jgi:hypothetical protein
MTWRRDVGETILIGDWEQLFWEDSLHIYGICYCCCNYNVVISSGTTAKPLKSRGLNLSEMFYSWTHRKCLLRTVLQNLITWDTIFLWFLSGCSNHTKESAPLATYSGREARMQALPPSEQNQWREAAAAAAGSEQVRITVPSPWIWCTCDTILQHILFAQVEVKPSEYQVSRNEANAWHASPSAK